MNASDTHSTRAGTGRRRGRIAARTLAFFGFLLRVLLIGWAALSIHYSNLPWPWLRTALALAFVAFGVVTLWMRDSPRSRIAFGVLFCAVAAWILSIPPSNDRNWSKEDAVLPRAYIEGDRVRITGVRDFVYRSPEDFDVRYLEREVSVSSLNSLDFYISYWIPGPVAHTFVSFNFDDAPPLSISIEARFEEDEEYAPVASLFRQFELIYVVGEERDIVGVRSNHRKEDVYLYRVQIPAEAARALFRVYLKRINELVERPEWYHLLKSNCTLNIVRYANMVGRQGHIDIRHILNGWSDRYLYRAGFLVPGLPFEVLREQSRINDAAQAAGDGDDFPQRIRASLPGMTAVR